MMDDRANTFFKARSDVVPDDDETVLRSGPQFVSSSTDPSVRICYETLGNLKEAPTIVFTPGGQSGRKSFVSSFAKRIIKQSSGKLSGVIWDRRNMGLSSTAYTGGDLTEQEANDLRDVILAVGKHRVFFYGTSSGARTGLTLAKSHPELFSGLILAPPTGGQFSAKFTANKYYLQYIPIAQNGGMQAVAETPYYKSLLKKHEAFDASSSSRQRLLSTSVETFAKTLETSARILMGSAQHPLLGITAVELIRIRELVPAILVMHHGFEDKVHTRHCAESVANLISADIYTPSTIGEHDSPANVDYIISYVTRALAKQGDGVCMPIPAVRSRL
jgi:pimeloyl-ACP methyl ester carboxylesterase